VSVPEALVAKAEIARRVFNIMDALVISGLIGLATLIFTMRDAMTRLQVTSESTNQQLTELRSQLANVPNLAERVSRSEARIEALERQQQEPRR
jgi:TolA-binding protein